MCEVLDYQTLRGGLSGPGTSAALGPQRPWDHSGPGTTAALGPAPCPRGDGLQGDITSHEAPLHTEPTFTLHLPYTLFP